MAKAENKKISVNALERVVKAYEQAGTEWSPDIVVTWNDLNVTIHRVLPLNDVINFVESVASACFAKDTHEYLPEVKDLAIRSNILDTYANFTMPKNLEQQLRFVYGTDAVDMVLEHVDRKQFAELIRSIDAKIDYLVRTDIESVQREIEKTAAAVDAVVAQFASTMDGMSKEDLNKIVEAVTGSKIDEEKLVKAFTKEKFGASDAGAPSDAGGEADTPADNVINITGAAMV